MSPLNFSPGDSIRDLIDSLPERAKDQIKPGFE
jgi:hypothetical protein